MQVVADRLSLRWYLGYDLPAALPDHSSLTRIRERYGLEIFRRFFEIIFGQCLAAGLVWGEELYIDATKFAANAALTSLHPRFAVEAHLAQLFTEQPPAIEPRAGERGDGGDHSAGTDGRDTPVPAPVALTAVARHSGRRCRGPARLDRERWTSQPGTDHPDRPGGPGRGARGPAGPRLALADPVPLEAAATPDHWGC